MVLNRFLGSTHNLIHVTLSAAHHQQAEVGESAASRFHRAKLVYAIRSPPLLLLMVLAGPAETLQEALLAVGRKRMPTHEMEFYSVVPYKTITSV